MRAPGRDVPQWAVLLALLFAAGEGARFLAFLPIPARSHQRIFQPLLRELALRGHEVTVVTPFPDNDPPTNYTQIILRDGVEEIKKNMNVPNEKEFLKMQGPFMSSIMMTAMRSFGDRLTELVLQQEEVQKLIKSDLKFDALILESSFLQEGYIALQHKFNAIVIEVVPVGNFHWAYWIYGNPYDTSYIVDCSLPYTDHMTFLERLHNTVASITMRGIWALYFMPRYQRLMDKYIQYEGWESRPPMMDMIRNTSLVLVNTHDTLNYPYPMAAHFKEVGGINLKPPKPLPDDLQTFMDSAKDGVIYFTLGSNINVSVMMDDLQQEFSRAFGKLKQKVLWKWETDFPDLPANVKISKWFPQQDILAHKNIKLFISHGGFLSLTESVYNGVPLIGIPILGDQHKNVVHMEHYGYGLRLDINNITESSISWAINEILSNPSYSEKAKERSSLYRDKPATALETAVFWVEYVLRHKGAPHLRPAVLSLSWYQEALLDVYAAIALAILIPTYISLKLTCKIIRCICRKKSKTVKKKRE